MLGTGTSHGVPMIGCDCRTCRSSDPRDRRSRPSILIERTDAGAGETGAQQAVRHILVDTSTDLRAQALALNVRRVDAILFTHSHADHILGLGRGPALQRDPEERDSGLRGCADGGGLAADLFVRLQ